MLHVDQSQQIGLCWVTDWNVYPNRFDDGKEWHACVDYHNQWGIQDILFFFFVNRIQDILLRIQSGIWYKGGKSEPAHRKHCQKYKQEYNFAAPNDRKWKPKGICQPLVAYLSLMLKITKVPLNNSICTACWVTAAQSTFPALNWTRKQYRTRNLQQREILNCSLKKPYFFPYEGIDLKQKQQRIIMK